MIIEKLRLIVLTFFVCLLVSARVLLGWFLRANLTHILKRQLLSTFTVKLFVSSYNFSFQ